MAGYYGGGIRLHQEFFEEWHLEFDVYTPSQMGEKPLATSGHLGKEQDRQQPSNEVCFG